MFPHQPNNPFLGGLDVRLRGGNGRIPIQNLHQVPRQEFLNCGFAEGQLPCQGSVQEPVVQQLGGNEKATKFSNVKYVQQQQHSFQQEPQEMRSEFIEQQQHVSQELNCSRQQNMQQLVPAELPETSYSALLHGPDTPPFRPEPSWDTSAEGEHRGAAADFKWPPKGVTIKDSARFGRCEGPLKPTGTQHPRSEQIRTEQIHPGKVSHRVSEGYTYSMKGKDVNERALLNPNMGFQKQHPDHHSIGMYRPPRSLHNSNFQQGFHDARVSQQHLPFQEWDGEKHNFSRPLDTSLQSNGQSSMQSQQHVFSSDMEKKDLNCSQPQSWEGITEESVSNQQEALPSREIPECIPNNFNLQQYNAWNVMHSQSMSRAYGNHMQHAADTTYNRWNTSAWQEGHPFMENTAYLPYGSGHMQMGPNHAPHDWQTHCTGAMVDGYSQHYPEGYYSYGSGMRQEANFIGLGKTDSAVPSPFETYGQHYQGPQVYLSPADQFLPGFGAPVIGAGCNTGPLRLADQNNHEKLVNTGGQVQPRQLQGTSLKGPHISHSVNLVKKSKQELTVKNGSARKESFEKDAELEGPQVKKLRECSEADAYHLKSCQSSGKFSPQLGVGSSLNVAEISGVDGAPSSQNSFDVQGTTIHSSVKDCQSEAFSQGSGFERVIDQQGQFSDTGHRTFQRSHMPSNFPPLWTKDAIQSEISTTLMPGMSNRNHTRSSSSVCSFENGAGLPQSGFIPEVRFLSGAQRLQEHGVNGGGFIPGGSHNVYREEFCSTRTNGSVSTTQDQSAANLLGRQSRERAQVASPPIALTPPKTSTFQQLATPAVALETVFPVQGSFSDAATQELPESHHTMSRPCNIGEGSGSLSTSSQRYQDTKTEQYAYGNAGHSYASIVDGGEYFIPVGHPEVEHQRTTYPVTEVYLSHLHPRVQTPEGKQFEFSKVGLLETGAQLRGLSRPALGKFYPPPPFHSHPSHLQRESGRVSNTRSENLTNFESGMVTSGTTKVVAKQVNYQATAGYMVEGGLLYPAADGSGIMKRGSVLSDSAQVHQLPVSSLEAGSMSTQQQDNMLLYAHTPESIPRSSHSSSITVESQGSAGPTVMLRDNEMLKASQPFGYSDPLATGRTLRQANGDEHPSGHFIDIHNVRRDFSSLRDCEPPISGKPLSEQIPQNASKLNLRASRTMQQKKRKKPVPYLIPWHIVTAQPRGQLTSISKAELMWATATNRLSDKDGGEVLNLGIFSAEGRLRLTTQLMQQIFSPLPSVLVHGKQPVSLECGVYNLAKSALGEACRLMAGTDREVEPAQKSTDLKLIASYGQTRTWNMAKEVAMTKLVERFMERVKRLDFERARLDCSMSVLELRGKSHDFERLSIVHRLGKHYGPDFSMNLSENRLVDAITNHGPLIRKNPPQRYVIAVPMPRTLPEGARCLSL